MSFRETDTIDIISDSPDRENGVDLLIVETPSDNTNETERYELLFKKLQTYVNYVMGQEFSQSFPQTEPSDVLIKVFYVTQPNAQMAQITHVEPDGDDAHQIPVVFQDYNEIPE